MTPPDPPGSAPRNVFVTGGSGFIGSRVVDRLVGDGSGAHVTTFQRRPDRAPVKPGVTPIRGDISRDDGSLDLNGHDTLIHLAAWIGFGIPRRKRHILFETNVGGTRRVMEAARKADVGRVVHVSSIAAFGATPPGVLADESFTRGDAVQSGYEASKLEAHRFAESFGRDHGIAVAIAMPGVVLGAGGDWDPLLRAVGNGRIPAYPSGDAGMNYVHVDDVADGIVRMIGHTGPFLLTDVNATVADFFTALAEGSGARPARARVPIALLHGAATVLDAGYRAFGRTPPVSREVTASLRVPMTFTNTKARKELGWEPDVMGRLGRDVHDLMESGS